MSKKWIRIHTLYVNSDLAILIYDPVNITSNGAVVTQAESNRIININNKKSSYFFDVRLDNLTLKGGNTISFGGAINTAENLRINKVTFELEIEL